MNSWINYHHLYYFKAIAEEESVSKAAKKLRLGQPTLSAQLKQLESSLEVELFERKNKKLFLTEQGKVTLEYARTIFKLGAEMKEVLNDTSIPTRPTVCIAALDSIPKNIILNMVQSAIKISKCQITLLEGKPDELLRELQNHQADILITNFLPAGTTTKGLKHRLFAKNKVAFYAAPKFKHLKKDFPISIKGHPVLLPTYDSKLRYDLDHWSQATNVPLDIFSESQDVAIKKLMATNALGLFPATTHTVTDELKNGTLIEIGKLQNIEEDLYLVTANRKFENEIAKKLFQTFNL